MTSAEDRQITILKEITIPRVTTLDAASQAMLMDTMREIQALNPDILASAVYYSACEGLVRAARALEYVYAAAAPDPLLCPPCASRNATHCVSLQLVAKGLGADGVHRLACAGGGAWAGP